MMLRYAYLRELFACVLSLFLSHAQAGNAADSADPRGKRDWTMVGGDAGNTRYSQLVQINVHNVGGLHGAWVRELGTKTRAAPIVLSGVLYTVDSTRIYALNAKTGESIWEYTPTASTPARGGVAVADGKLFCGLADTHVVALDARTGALQWTGYIGNQPSTLYDKKQELAFSAGFPAFDPKIGFITGAPTVLDGKVVFGLTGGDGGTRSKIAALDATTGKLAWEWWVVPSPGEPGAQTWPDDFDVRTLGGGAVWSHGAVDAKLGLMYFGTGNASPIIGGEVRRGDNLYMTSLVALDVNTGRLRWHFQLTHHDLWEMDVSTPPILYDFKGSGRIRKAVAVMRTDGYLFSFDRATGEPLIPIDNRPVKQDARLYTAPTQPYPAGVDQVGPNCAEPELIVSGFVPACFFEPIYYDRSNLLVEVANVRQAPMSLDPNTGYFYVAGGASPWWYRRLDNPYVLLVGHPPGQKEYGVVAALSGKSHKIVWQNRSPWELIASSGLATTAGGLLFRTEGDGNVMAFDSRSGAHLWSFQTGSVPGPTVNTLTGGAPIAIYEADGVQYLVAPMGKTLWAFSLSGKLSEHPASLIPPTEYGFQGIVAPLGAGDEIGIATLQPTRAPGPVHYVEEASFSPSRAQVAVGQPVKFTNYGIATHTIVTSDGSWTTGPVAPGQSVSLPISKPGKYVFFATEYPWSKGQLIVR